MLVLPKLSLSALFFISLISFAQSESPTLYFNADPQSSPEKYKKWHEYADLQEESNVVWRTNASFTGKWQEIEARRNHLPKKFLSQAKLIASKKQAYALFEFHGQDLVYGHDITNEIIDELNKEYAASKPRNKTFVQPQDLLFLGIKADNADQISKAIQLGADIYQPKYGISLLKWALLCKSDKAVKFLIDAGVIIEDDSVQFAVDCSAIKSGVYIAVKNNISPQLLYKRRGSSVDITLKSLVAQNGDIESLLLMLQNGWFKDDSSSEIIYSNMTLMDVLLAAGESFPHNPNLNQIRDCINKLIFDGYNLETVWQTRRVIDYGSIFNNPEILKIFIPRIKINQAINDLKNNRVSWTPLMLAVKTFNHHRNLGSIELLLQAGANPKQKMNIVFDDKFMSNIDATELALLLKEPGLLELLLSYA